MGKVEISIELLANLIRDSEKLGVLEGSGVDNWEGYMEWVDEDYYNRIGLPDEDLVRTYLTIEDITPIV